MNELQKLGKHLIQSEKHLIQSEKHLKKACAIYTKIGTLLPPEDTLPPPVKFVPPNQAQVYALMLEWQLSEVDAKRESAMFIDYYTNSRWKVARGVNMVTMISWRGGVRTWVNHWLKRGGELVTPTVKTEASLRHGQ